MLRQVRATTRRRRSASAPSITYDLDLDPRQRRARAAASPSRSTPATRDSQARETPHDPRSAPRGARARPACGSRARSRGAPPPSRLRQAGDAGLEGAGGRGQAVRARAGARSSNGRSTWACPAPTASPTSRIPTFARGELPHFAGINTFLKAPYVENVRDVGKYDAAVIGIPFDSGTTYRPGTRFGPQGIRRISALYTPYNYELGVDLREQMTLCDAGDVFTIPANLEKSFDQITRGVAHVFSSGALPLMLGGDHSIGFPCVRGIAQCTSKRIGIIHFDRHIDIQEKDLDERMHTTPWYWATNLPNVPATNLVQLGIGGWQVPRYGVAGGAQARHQRAHHRRHREAGPGEDRRDRARAGLEGRRRGLHLLRRRLHRLRLRARHRLARARRLPAARGAEAPGPGRAPKACAASRWSRSRRPTTPPTSRRCSACASSSRCWARWSPTASSAAHKAHHRQAGQPTEARHARDHDHDHHHDTPRRRRVGHDHAGPGHNRAPSRAAWRSGRRRISIRTTTQPHAQRRARPRPGRGRLRRGLRSPPPTRRASCGSPAFRSRRRRRTARRLRAAARRDRRGRRRRRGDAASRRRLVPLRPAAGARWSRAAAACASSISTVRGCGP